MSIPKFFLQLSLSLFVFSAVGLFVPHTVFCQTEKLGIVSYAAPKGWSKTPKENIVTYSQFSEATARFCVITVYGATPSADNPQSEFAREWNNLVIKPWQGEANPKTETESADGWTAIAGGSAVDFQGNKAVAFLTVFSGFKKTVSVLGIFNDEAYMTQLVALVSSIKMDRTVAEKPAPPIEESVPPAPAVNAAALHVVEVVREFERNEIRARQIYVGKRVRIFGTVNSIVIGTDGRILLTFKSSMGAYGNVRCYFNKSQGSRVSRINANEEATVEGTVRGWEDGFSGAKVFVLFEDCIVP